jgi:hypothetical protein
MGICTSDEESARRKAFQQSSEALIADKIAAIWQEYVWLCK